MKAQDQSAEREALWVLTNQRPPDGEEELEVEALFNSPQPAFPAQARMPLSDKQIDELWLFRIDLHDGEILRQVRDFAREVEAAHGISGESSRATNGVDQPATPSLSRGNAMRLLSLYATALKDDNEEMREQWAEEIIARLSGTHGVTASAKTGDGGM